MTQGAAHVLPTREETPPSTRLTRPPLKPIERDPIAADRLALSESAFKEKYGDRAAYTYLDRLPDID